jgi:hypothetical protein
VPGLRRTASAIGTAACMAAAFAAAMTAPASAQTTASAAPAAVSATATAASEAVAVKLTTAAGAAAAVKLTPAAAPSWNDCSDYDGYNAQDGFWRCTGTSPSSPWVWSSCTPGNYDAISSYNVYIFTNLCNTRVWMHQYTSKNDVNNGWAKCTGPYEFGNDNNGLSAANEVHPENIQVTTNTADC